MKGVLQKHRVTDEIPAANTYSVSAIRPIGEAESVVQFLLEDCD